MGKKILLTNANSCLPCHRPVYLSPYGGVMSFLSSHARDIRVFCLGVTLSLLAVTSLNYFTYGGLGIFISGSAACNTAMVSEGAVPMAAFPEPAWRKPETLAAHVVTSTPFARFEVHQVRTDSGQIVNDWLWTDERSHVNLLVTIHIIPSAIVYSI
jgi:hypothetical protein